MKRFLLLPVLCLILSSSCCGRASPQQNPQMVPFTEENDPFCSLLSVQSLPALSRKPLFLLKKYSHLINRYFCPIRESADLSPEATAVYDREASSEAETSPGFSASAVSVPSSKDPPNPSYSTVSPDKEAVDPAESEPVSVRAEGSDLPSTEVLPDPESTLPERTEEETVPVSSAPPVTEPSAEEDRDAAYALLSLFNAVREEAGLPLLAWEEEAYPLALYRARELLTDFSHSYQLNRLTQELGLPQYYQRLEEIITRPADGSPERAMSLFQASPAHWQRVLDEEAVSCAIAVLGHCFEVLLICDWQ